MQIFSVAMLLKIEIAQKLNVLAISFYFYAKQR